ncbi:MAG: histidine kinase [Betaproteobacteria bacterium CG2_30_59_46]|nr:MAG: histidine kinase [Betaproteobacteria bacterium CG2_30_59_46]PIQ14158.1 MAG: histidine kinase [Hydrogenophilales bacterium CG18_big_fil_WC_8_21_14_2_50_58_12]PIY01410.1 MAG: histidine kinase [Hydrogenophilales bacterium CG_4_10_14_3_um_filter_58_23]PJB05056.1 MAG: histidine kinase [Hydrogenophilales bacterium CG_4_9_14_3_um_filter_59_35]
MLSDKVTKLSWVYQLYRLGQTSLLRDRPQQAQHAILEHIVEGFGANSGTLALIEEDNQPLTIVAGIDIPDHVIGSKIERGSGILGLVAETGQALLLNGDISNDTRFKFSVVRDKSQRPRSAMCWPLKIEDRVIGALSINRRDTDEPYTDEDLANGSVVVNLITVVIENTRLYRDQEKRIAMLSKMNSEIRSVNKRLEDAQNQLLQSEKMASIGQLAAGVAHEINNPVGYINSNLGTLQKYLRDLFDMLAAYEQAEPLLAEHAEALRNISALKAKLDIAYLKEDVSALMSESQEGITRVKKIVQDLKDFSHVDEAEWQLTDIHKGIDSTLNIVWNEIKYKAEVIKVYGELPEVECLASQLNQVFMNILINAAHAIEDRGIIFIRTGMLGDDQVWVEIADSGKGIPAENLNRIFDPFFTTKPVGKGTGLGLSLSYSIVQKHHGHINVSSEVGVGTIFRVYLPVKQPEKKADQ